jgi:transaldolase
VEIFLDTGDLNEIRFWLSQGVVDGVTTNPTIMLAAGNYDLRAAAGEIAALLGSRPVSVEVVSDDPAEMLLHGRDLATIAPNVVVKIPIETTDGRPCMDVVHRLARDGVQVNATACLSFGQAMLAAKAGATYVSLFGGRISDEGNDPKRVIGLTAQWLSRWGYPAKIIVGSVREAINVQDAAEAGAHVVTIPPKFLRQLADHHYSRFTAQQFLRDGQATQKQLETVVAARLLEMASQASVEAP